MQKPNNTLGMRHLALRVSDMAACQHFYVDLLGMQIEWQPDADNLYLTSGVDNLALHRVDNVERSKQSPLDHLGFILATPEDVDDWFAFLQHHNVVMKTNPVSHRDGAKSFYCQDPEGNTVQMIFHPPLVK